MSMEQSSPCCVLFDTMKTFGSISNYDLAYTVLSDKTYAGGKSLRDRVNDRTYLSRAIVHSMPGELPETSFSDFEQSAFHVIASMKADVPPRTDDDLIAYFSGQGARDMATALKSLSLDYALYLNTVRGLQAIEGLPDSARAHLLVLLFLTTGCLQDPRRAADFTLRVAENGFNAHLLTQAAQTLDQDLREGQEAYAKDVRLALFRVVGSRMCGGPYRLSIAPEGTEIGYLSTSEDSITDVEKTVSRRHLKVFRADDGDWYVRGLNSRNGTVLVSGEDRSEMVIEPPRDAAGGFIPRDVRIQPGDRLILARDTVFMVVQVDPDR